MGVQVLPCRGQSIHYSIVCFAASSLITYVVIVLKLIFILFIVVGYFLMACRSFLELLKDPEQLELFHFFLQSQGRGASSTETQLLFWMAIEDVKASMGNRKACNFKIKKIQQRFFGANSGVCGIIIKASL